MKVRLGQYLPGNSFLHRADPRLKILLMLAAMIIVFILNQAAGFLLYGSLLLGTALLSGTGIKKLLVSVKSIIYIALFAFLINLLTADTGETLWTAGPLSITTGGLFGGFKIILRLLYLVTTSSLLLTLTTTPMKVADGLEALMKPLTYIRVPVHDVAMMMSIALRFVPTLAAEAEKIMKAQMSRGADFESGSLRRRGKGLVALLVPLFVSAFQRADELALAMEARCYRGGEGKTRLNPLSFSRTDLWLALLAVLGLAACLLLDRLL